MVPITFMVGFNQTSHLMFLYYLSLAIIMFLEKIDGKSVYIQLSEANMVFFSDHENIKVWFHCENVRPFNNMFICIAGSLLIITQ